MPKLVLIAAVADNGAIGLNNDLPWGRSLPRDMERFKQITSKVGTVLMGRKTAESLPKPLKDRRNVVLSRAAWSKEGFDVFPDLASALAACETKAIAVSGGAEIYKLCAPYASLAYITRVCTALKGDAFFPIRCFDDYVRKGDVTSHPSDQHNKHAMQFFTLANNNPQPLPERE